MATTSMNNPQKHAEQKMKTIVIFDLSFNFISTNGSLQTQFLEMKLAKFLREKNQSWALKIYEASQIDEHASEADIILLTPTFAYAKEEIEKKFPQILVIAISKAEYGTMDLDHLWKKIKTVL